MLCGLWSVVCEDSDGCFEDSDGWFEDSEGCFKDSGVAARSGCCVGSDG
jgi:hypothetical protein